MLSFDTNTKHYGTNSYEAFANIYQGQTLTDTCAKKKKALRWQVTVSNTVHLQHLGENISVCFSGIMVCSAETELSFSHWFTELYGHKAEQ